MQLRQDERTDQLATGSAARADQPGVGSAEQHAGQLKGLPGAKTGLPFFTALGKNYSYDSSSVSMSRLRARLEASDKQHLVSLVEGWSGSEQQSRNAVFFQVPDEGVIRSMATAVAYL